MLHRPSKAVMAPIAEAVGTLAGALTQPFISRDVGYVQDDPGQKSRKVRNHMLKSPFKSVIARAATFALVLSLGIAFVTVGLAPSASAQEAEEPPCKVTDEDTGAVTCDYNEEGMDPVANFSAMDPEGENIVWSLNGDDASDFTITGGVLAFKNPPSYEDPKGTPVSGTEGDNSYEVMVVATEVRAPGSLDLAQSNRIMVTVNVQNIEEDPTLSLDRLQVRASAAADDTTGGSMVTASLTDGDGPAGDATEIAVTYAWYVPKVNRPDLVNEDHWIAAGGVTSGDGNETYRPVSSNAGNYLRVVATYTDGFGTEMDKAYARTAHPVADPRDDLENNEPDFPAGTAMSFIVSEHAAVGTYIGTVRGSDDDSNDILSHRLTATGEMNMGKFAIDMATGRITVASKLDFEDAPLAQSPRTGRDYTVTITAYDPSGEDTDPVRTINIKVTNQNDAPLTPVVGLGTPASRTPQNDAQEPSYEVNENHAVKDVEDDTTTTEVNEERTAVVLATFEIDDDTDPDVTDDIAALTVTTGGADGGLFSLTDTDDFGGQAGDNEYDLVFKESPNYESPADADGNNMYHVTIVTTDNEDASHSLPLVVTVNNVDEDGSVSFSTTQPAVGEAITATLTDPDMKVNAVEWQWGRSDTTDSFIAIQGATSDTYTPVKSVPDNPVTSENEAVDGDEGMYLEVTVKYLDNASVDDPDTTTVDESKVKTEIEEHTDNAVREEPEVNQAPVFDSGITREVPETAGAGDNVGAPVKATDPDAGDDLSYTITGGADMGSFEITAANRSSGQITVKKGTELDYEGTQTTYVVEVTARDPFGLEDSTMVTIMVTDENEMPEIALPGDPCKEVQGSDDAVTCDYDEEGMNPVVTISAMDPEGEMITWSLGGNDAEDFDITGGVLSFKSSPSYETPKGSPATDGGAADNSYEVTVNATEVRAPGSLEIAQDAFIMVTVNVKNIEEDPTLTLNRLQVRAGVTAATITATLTDPDRAADADAPNYQWYVPKVSRPDLENEDHWIEAEGGGNAEPTYTTTADDAGKRLRVVATYTDGFGTDNDMAYARMAHPVAAVRADNNPPSFPAGTAEMFVVTEHAAVGTNVGTVRGSDVDSSDILTHELTAATGTENVGKFKIDPATGRITVGAKLDFETAPDAGGGRTGQEYTVTVQVYDPSGAHTDGDQTDIGRTIIIQVTDQNDAPGKPDVGVTTESPQDGSPAMPTYMVVENHPVKDVAEDTNTDEIEFRNAVELATFTVDNETDEDGEDSPTLGDPADTLKLTAGGADGGLFDLNENADTANQYDLVFKESPNYESPADADGNNKYHVTIITTDNEGASSSLPLVVTVLNIEEPGKVTLSHAQPAIGEPITATLTDPDTKVVEVEWQWSRSDSTDGWAPIQGATSDTYTPVKSVPDDPITSENEGIDGDEGMYLQVTVMYRDNASDKVDDTDTADVDESKVKRTIPKHTDNAVRARPDVNQAPVFASGITREVREDAEEGDPVGSRVTASDPDGDSLSYTISGGADMDAFEITSDNRSNGQITVAKGADLDYEGPQRTYVVEVTASDPFGLSASTMVTITVTDFNEKPELMLIGAGTTAPSAGVVGGLRTVYVQEGTTTVGPYVTTIEDPSSWTLSGPDAGDFSISSGGDLSFRSEPDYENPTDANTDNVYMVTVMANNGNGGAELDVTVTVTNDTSDDVTTPPSTCGGAVFDPWCYDANNNGSIEKEEVLDAIDDYFDDVINKENVLDVIDLYFG